MLYCVCVFDVRGVHASATKEVAHHKRKGLPWVMGDKTPAPKLVSGLSLCLGVPEGVDDTTTSIELAPVPCRHFQPPRILKVIGAGAERRNTHATLCRQLVEDGELHLVHFNGLVECHERRSVPPP